MYPQPYRSQPLYIQQPQPPKNTAMKTAAISLFATGFVLKLIGLLLIVFVIGLVPLILGAVCDVVAFICLCLI
jgi:uncharacterized membrane protein